VVVEDAGPIAESCRHLALRIRSELERRSAASVVITSALRGEGKSTLSCDLALAMASLSRGPSVALVDLDLRRGHLRLGRKAGARCLPDAVSPSSGP
jgi:Mrp family chromosome partitioning ATPase